MVTTGGQGKARGRCDAHPTSADLVIDYKRPNVVHMERHIDKGANSLYHEMCTFLASAWYPAKNQSTSCPAAIGQGGVKISFREGNTTIYPISLSFTGCPGVSDDQGRYAIGAFKNLETYNQVVSDVEERFSVSIRQLSGET